MQPRDRDQDDSGHDILLHALCVHDGKREEKRPAIKNQFLNVDIKNKRCVAILDIYLEYMLST